MDGSIITAIITVILSGLISFGIAIWQTKKNRKFQLRSEKAAFVRDAQKTKPRLEIVEHENLENTDSKKRDLDLLLIDIEEVVIVGKYPEFHYSKKALDDSNLFCYDFAFENTGKTEIDRLTVGILCNGKASIVDKEAIAELYRSNFINFESFSEKRNIKPGDKVFIRFWFLKERYYASDGYNSILLILEDSNGVYWTQALCCKNNYIENSRYTDKKYLSNLLDVQNEIDVILGKKFD